MPKDIFSPEDPDAEELEDTRTDENALEISIAEFQLALDNVIDRQLAVIIDKIGEENLDGAHLYELKRDFKLRKEIRYWPRLFRLLDSGYCRDMEELVECYLVEPPNGYVILKKLGSGGFKTAYYAINEMTSRECVLLMIDPIENGILWYRELYPDLDNEEIIQKIHKDEFSALELREHPEIRYVAKPSGPMPGSNSKGERVAFLEVAAYAKTLLERLEEQELGPETAFKYILQIALAFKDCHGAGFIFKDFKETNIGVTKDDTIVLADFGRIDTFSQEANSRYFCPLGFRPPELAHTQEYWKEHPSESQSACFSPEFNVWNLGILVYRFFTGTYPFDIPPRDGIVNGSQRFHDRAKYVYDQIQRFSERKNEIFETLQSINPDARKIAEWCLQENPADRKGALDKIIDLLQNRS